MDLDPPVPACKTSDQHSFAHVSAKDRWPKILTSAIDDVHRTTAAIKDDAVAEKEGKALVESLATLKYEMQHNRKLIPLEDDGVSDFQLYNAELEERGHPNWFDVSWLYAECYLYRRVSSLFKLSTKWKEYDIFSRQKLSTFKSSRPAVLELAGKYREIMSQFTEKSSSDKSPEEIAKAEEILFREMCEICLWGNATDLSLLTNLSYDDIQKLQGTEARKSQQSNVLVNDLPKAFAQLKESQKQNPNGERRVDFALDNAGFELYVDLILAGYLVASGLATTIVLHPKSIPWFVSDVIPKDFASLLDALRDPQAFYAQIESEDGQSSRDNAPLSETDADNLIFLFHNWADLHQEGKLIIRPNRFWTHAGSYWRMPKVEPDLYNDLKESELVIFKGDLHYRKLTGDVWWDPTTSFKEAIGPLANDGLRVLALRTAKADVVVGLAEGEDQKLRNTEGGGGDSGERKWAWSGKWALVQYNDGNGP